MFLLSKLEATECPECGGEKCCTCPYHHHFISLTLNVFVKPERHFDTFLKQCEWWVTKAVAHSLKTLAKRMPKFSPNAFNWATLKYVSESVSCTTRARLAGMPPSLDALAAHLISELGYVLSSSRPTSHISDNCNYGGYLKVTLERGLSHFAQCQQAPLQPTSLQCVKGEDIANQLIIEEVFQRKIIPSSSPYLLEGLLVQHNNVGTFYFANEQERLHWMP